MCEPVSRFPATAVKLANRELTVVAAGGDGDGYAIGAGHFLHAVRRNPNVTYIVMDNQTYGLTKGQSSPTSRTGYVTGTSPSGNPDAPINGLAVALRQADHFSRAASPRIRRNSSICSKWPCSTMAFR